MKNNFNKSPVVELKGNHHCFQGWDEIGTAIKEDLPPPIRWEKGPGDRMLSWSF